MRRLSDIPEAQRARLVSESTAKRFANLYAVELDTGCFTWTGALRSGRGQLRTGTSHRVCAAVGVGAGARPDHGEPGSKRSAATMRGSTPTTSSQWSQPKRSEITSEPRPTVHPGTPTAPRTPTSRRTASGCAGLAGDCDHSVTNGPQTSLSGQRPQACDLRFLFRNVARGGGLEPPMAGPEPAVLPITPPPKGDESC